MNKNEVDTSESMGKTFQSAQLTHESDIFFLLSQGLSWYTELLEQTTTEDISNSEKKINAKNCVGTVLTLNGHRRYFSMYHAQHPEGANTRFSHTNSGKKYGILSPKLF